MKTFIALGAAGALALGALAGTAAAQPNGNGGKASGKNLSGPGKIDVGVGIYPTWASAGETDTITGLIGPDTDADEGIFPVLGSGQVNGEFVTAERYGIQVGIRAQERTQGTIEAQAGRGKRPPATYQAETGFSPNVNNRCWWNFDWHVDLRGAKGVAKGTTLGDYKAVIEANLSEDQIPIPTLEPFADLPLKAVLEGDYSGADGDDAVLYQNSWNPVFYPGIDEAFCQEEGMYDVRVVLTPETFNGPPLAAAMTVQVADPTL